MSDSDAGFLSRWSRRKALVRQGAEPPEVPVTPPVSATPVPSPPVAGSERDSPPSQTRPVTAEAPASPGPAGATEGSTPAARPAPPTMQDVQSLTPSSDFSRFVGRDVDPQVKNAAMKKLFADPHFNVMDGLDTYIDDYHTPDPLPKAMMRQLVQARMLGLLDDEMPEQPAAQEAAEGPSDSAGVSPQGADGGESLAPTPEEPPAGEDLASADRSGEADRPGADAADRPGPRMPGPAAAD